jgi:hypothetical protein
MANATTDRKTVFTPEAILRVKGPYGIPAATKVPRGVAQVIDDNNRMVNPGTTTEVVAGVTHDAYDNSAGVADAVKGELYEGPHCFAAHGVNPPTVADVEKMGYMADNQTVSRLAADGSPAGVIEGIESDGQIRINIGKRPLA